MTDVTQGADAPNEAALFHEATSNDAETLTKFENPPPVAEPEKPAPPPPAEKPEPSKSEDNAPVPAGRLREEAEARRKVERERDELRARLDAVQRPPPQQQAPPQKPDLFENPSAFVQAELTPFLERMEQQHQAQREAMSLDFARQRFGPEKVDAAYRAMEAGINQGNPEVYAAYQRIMKSHDPYGAIVRWHGEAETLRTIGGDLDGYKKRVLEEALADPEYRKRAIEAAKGQAATHVTRPVTVASSPSLGNIGATGGDTTIVEPSDAELFRAATTAKRR
jgi:hypothetical protein